MSEWKEKRFGDLVSFPPKVKLIKGKEYPFILMEEIEPKTKFVNTNISKPYDGSGSRFENGDTLFARITPSLENGKIAQAKGLNNPGFGSTELYVFRAKKDISDKDFIYYLCHADFFIQNAINSYVGASGRQRADAKFIANTILKVPDYKKQHRIASILSTYDELIENNNRRIAILEQTAEQIYKEWFVRMRFPGYENTEFEKGVPKGWETKKIDEVTSLITRGIPPKYDEAGSSLAINQKCIRDGRVNMELCRRQSKPYPKTKQIKFGDILINSTGEGTLGRVAQIYFSVERVTIDTHVTIVRANSEINIDYLGYYLLSLQDFFAFMAVGSTNQTELSRNTIKNAKIILPEINLQNKFSELISPLRLKIEILLSKNQNLKQTRDLLLPRLISGKLKVKEAEKI